MLERTPTAARRRDALDAYWQERARVHYLEEKADAVAAHLAGEQVDSSLFRDDHEADPDEARERPERAGGTEGTEALSMEERADIILERLSGRGSVIEA